MENEIKEIILSYCQGICHLEFDESDLEEMVSKIAKAKQLALCGVVKSFYCYDGKYTKGSKKCKTQCEDCKDCEAEGQQ